MDNVESLLEELENLVRDGAAESKRREDAVYEEINRIENFVKALKPPTVSRLEELENLVRESAVALKKRRDAEVKQINMIESSFSALMKAVKALKPPTVETAAEPSEYAMNLKSRVDELVDLVRESTAATKKREDAEDKQFKRIESYVSALLHGNPPPTPDAYYGVCRQMGGSGYEMC